MFCGLDRQLNKYGMPISLPQKGESEMRCPLEHQVGPIASEDGSMIATRNGIAHNPDWPWLKKLVERITKLEERVQQVVPKPFVKRIQVGRRGSALANAKVWVTTDPQYKNEICVATTDDCGTAELIADPATPLFFQCNEEDAEVYVDGIRVLANLR